MAERTNYPVDDDKNIYIEAGFDKSLSDIINIIHEKWGADVNIDDVIIDAEYRHVRCIGYDLHDSSDYDTYIHIYRNE